MPRARPSQGHNEPLTDDERRALTLHHLAKIEKAQAAAKAARDLVTVLTTRAQADLGKDVKKDFKEYAESRDKTKLRERMERSIRIARWHGLPVGAMGDLFSQPPQVDTVREAGRLAGCEGAECRVPDGYVGSDAVTWVEGWHAGQDALMAGFKKLVTDEEGEDAQGVRGQTSTADTSDPPFIPPAEMPEAPQPPAAS